MIARRRAPLVHRSVGTSLDRLLSRTRRKRPTALLVHSDSVAQTLRTNLQTPPEIAWLNLSHPRRDEFGVVTGCEEAGVIAVDLLVEQLRCGARGLLAAAKRILCPGRLTPGRESEATRAGILTDVVGA